MEDSSLTPLTPLTPDFLQSFMNTHYSSLVSNLRIKYKDKQPVWIDIQMVTVQELRELDEDDEINKLIRHSVNVRYKDRDY
jgi:hypothetical protein